MPAGAGDPPAGAGDPPAGAGDPPAPAAVPGVPGPMQRLVVFLSSGGRCRSSSGGFDWRDVSQVAVPFACGFFSSAGKFYRSSSVCSDRILTCRIKSICSPAKGGTGCYRFNYQPGS